MYDILTIEEQIEVLNKSAEIVISSRSASSLLKLLDSHLGLRPLKVLLSIRYISSEV